MAGPTLPERLHAALVAARSAGAAPRRLRARWHRAAPATPDAGGDTPVPRLLLRSSPSVLDAVAAEAIARVGFEDRLERALAPATSMEAVLSVARRALEAVDPATAATALTAPSDPATTAGDLSGTGPVPTELLLVHPRTGRLFQAIEVGPEGEGPGCPVAAASGCEAMRTGRTQVYDNSEALDACPHLADRVAACSAACVPVMVLGDATGVLHRTGPLAVPPSSLAVAQLGLIGSRIGERLALLRAIDAPAPATIDRLTGALDRASVEARALELARNLVPFCLVQCDVDGFQDYTARFGAELAGRGLRTLASAAREILRPDDLVGRFGDDELLLVLPDTSYGECQRALERVREHLVLTLIDAGLPPLTCSYGVVESSMGRSLDELLVAADAAVALAKDRGRNQVVVALDNMLDDYPGMV